MGVMLPLLLIALALPIGLAVAHGLTQARWIMQDTPRAYVFMGIVALAIAVVMLGPALWIARAHIGGRALAGGLLWAALAGWYGGPLLLNLLNHTADAAAQPVEVKVLGSGGRQLVQLGVVSTGATGTDGHGPDGVVFTCGKVTWQAHYRGAGTTTPARLYRGRLGLFWLEL